MKDLHFGNLSSELLEAWFVKYNLGKGSKKINHGKFHIGSRPPPRLWKKKLFFFLKLDHFLRTFCKKCIFTIENPKKLRKFFKKWSSFREKNF